MDVLKVAGRVGAVGRQALTAAVQQQQLETERKVLAELRAGALTLRAQIGEEMYKLWKAGQPCPPWLDDICRSLDSTSAAIGRQRSIIDQLVRGVVAGDAEPDQETSSPVDVIGQQAALLGEQSEPLPALAAATDAQADSSRVTCPTCGETDAPGRRFCGSCGSKLP